MDSSNSTKKDGSWVTPGEKLGMTDDLAAGDGAYIRGKHVYAKVLGRVSISKAAKGEGGDGDTDDITTKPSVCIVSRKSLASSKVLRVDQIILGRVLRISTQQASIEILVGESSGPLKESRQGMLRKDDVNKGPSENVVIADSFRPGDLILARIISLGDARRYILSTAEDNLGVVRASSRTSGKFMAAANSSEMICEETKTTEKRKCAEPKEASAIYELLVSTS
jgi:exosome complex component CSL4